MLFNSFSFLIFFPIVTYLYFILPHRFRWGMLLAASCIFYMWFIPKYIIILAITIVIDYAAGILIENSSGKERKNWLVISIISTCLVLFLFKYFNFFNENFSRIAHALNLHYPIEALSIILPVGLSFHTFQSLSYVIEVYRGNQKAERHFGIYSLYVMFYPQLVAGPIERPQNLLHQFYEKHEFEVERVTDGLKLMAWGMFKKVVIADRLALFVNQVYDTHSAYNGVAYVIATIFFAFQIYCDFSGYSDMAIGAARVMGFKLMKNFNRPYLSKSISEFWKRWHISLSTWFKDYLYISLGGNRCSAIRWQFNLFFTFLVSGFWHGANWTYIIWGGLNGFYLVFSLWTQKARKRIIKSLNLNSNQIALKIIQVTITFSLVCFSWIFFRSRSTSIAFEIINNLHTGWKELFSNLITNGLFALSNMNFLGTNAVSVDILTFYFNWLLILFLIFIHLLQERFDLGKLIKKQKLYVRWIVYFVLVYGIILGRSFTQNEFIYFQF